MRIANCALAALGINIALTAGAAGAILSGPIVSPVNGHSYYLLDKSTWGAAESQAVGLGGHLATVRNAAENAWIFSTFSHFASTPRDLWIGLSDAGHEGTFTWSSGETPGYTNWQVGQPDNGAGAGAENYVHMNTSRPSGPHVAGWVDGRWNDFVGNADSYIYFGGVAIQEVDGVVEIIPRAPAGAPLPAAALIATPLGAALVWLRERRRVGR